MKKLFVIALLLICLAPSAVYAVDALEFGLAPTFGYTVFFARMGEIISPDITYGCDFVYGILPWLGLDFELLYSEHQQTDSKEIGSAQFNHLQTGIGPRFSYNGTHVIPYGTLHLGGNFYHWENQTIYGDDDFDGNGIAGYLTLGLDFKVADMATLGIAGKGALTRSDFELITNKDGSETLGAYAFTSLLFRFTLVF